MKYIYPSIDEEIEIDDDEIIELLKNRKLPIIPNLKMPIINPLGYVCRNADETEINYSIRYNNKSVLIMVFVPGINEDLVQDIDISAKDENNNTIFVIKIEWQNIYKKLTLNIKKHFSAIIK